jgi:hypothetical protein
VKPGASEQIYEVVLLIAWLSLERDIALHVSSFQVICSAREMCLGAETTHLLASSVLIFATNSQLNLLLFQKYLLYIFWWLPRKPLQHLNICYVTLFSWQILFLENTQWEERVRKLLNPLMTKRRLLYLKPQSVPRCKHFISVIKINQFKL